MNGGAGRFDGYLSGRAAGGQPARREPTPAERRVLECLSHGMTVSMAADALGIAFSTAESQMKEARERMAAKSAAHAVAICLRNGWLH